MSNGASGFELPNTIDRYLAALSKLYAQEGKRQLQELIVNAQTRIHEGWSRDNWNGGTYGHALYLVLPEPLFLSIVNQKADIQTQIKDDLNKIHNVQNEFIEEVFMEMEVGEDHDWRNDSGLLLTGQKVVPPKAAQRIWGDGGFRVFLSHKSEVKKETANLKEQLIQFGISCFVAHQDIEPTKEWQNEIENALTTMDGFIALLTEKFHDSNWTDQEIGFAFAKGVPIFAIRLGKDPYGFIGKFQGLATTWPNAANDILKLILKNDRAFFAYVRVLRQCKSWIAGNVLGKALPWIETLTETQVDELIAAYNETPELRGSFAFNGGNAREYGSGLVAYVQRFSSRQFRFTEEGMIEQVTLT